jgi:hypothetical protein
MMFPSVCVCFDQPNLRGRSKALKSRKIGSRTVLQQLQQLDKRNVVSLGLVELGR